MGDLLTSGSGSGTPLIQLGVLSLAEQSHTQIFLAWLSSATLKNFISGVSSRILMRLEASLVYSSSRLRRRPQKGRQPQK